MANNRKKKEKKSKEVTAGWNKESMGKKAC